MQDRRQLIKKGATGAICIFAGCVNSGQSASGSDSRFQSNESADQSGSQNGEGQTTHISRDQPTPDPSNFNEGVPGTITLAGSIINRASEDVNATLEVLQNRLGVNEPAKINIRLENKSKSEYEYEFAERRGVIIGQYESNSVGIKMYLVSPEVEESRINQEEPCHVLEEGYIDLSQGRFTLGAGKVYESNFEVWAVENNLQGICLPEGIYNFAWLGTSFSLSVTSD